MSDDPRVIKRYANRKLYDTDLRRFTTLDDLSGLLERGIRFVVRDHDSGDDRTDEILAQVLGRRVRGGGAGAPTDLLSGLLRAPTQIAQQLVGEAVAPPEPEKKPAKKAAKKASGKSGAKSGKKKDPASSGKKKAGKTAQEKELEELRSQVSELTQAVSLLVQDRLAEKQGSAANDDDA